MLIYKMKKSCLITLILNKNTINLKYTEYQIRKFRNTD